MKETVGVLAEKNKPMPCFCTGFCYLCTIKLKKAYGKEPVEQVCLAGRNHL